MLTPNAFWRAMEALYSDMDGYRDWHVHWWTQGEDPFDTTPVEVFLKHEHSDEVVLQYLMDFHWPNGLPGDGVSQEWSDAYDEIAEEAKELKASMTGIPSNGFKPAGAGWTSPMRTAYAWAEREPRLTHRDVSVLLAMIGNGDDKGQDVYVGQPRVAYRLRYNRTTISRAIQNLEKLKVLTCTRQATQHYTATWKLNPAPSEPWNQGKEPWKPPRRNGQ